MKNQRPKILLMGNGILQSFGGESWNEFLSSICKRDDLPSPDKINCPEPLKAILLTGDRVDKAMKEKCDKILANQKISEELAKFLKSILSLEFDHILTTNYTYELEQAAIYPKKLTEYKLKKMAKCTVGNVEPKYLLHTYNSTICDGAERKIWHVHGESRKPSSTILGHYYYGNSLFKIKEIVDKIKRVDDEFEANSWPEAFLFADIYCIGFGYGLSEFDLWWLLNRKARENYNEGKLYFYEPYSRSQWEKLELMSLLKTTGNEPLVNIIDLGYNADEGIDWKSFYLEAIEDIKEKISAKPQNEKEVILV
jgi:hypothetical protein